LFLLRVLKTFAENPEGTKSTAKTTSEERPIAVTAYQSKRLTAGSDEFVTSELANSVVSDAADKGRVHREP